MTWIVIFGADSGTGSFRPTPVTPMSWWWEYFENRGMMTYFRGVREISDRMLAAGNGAFETVKADCTPLEAMSVKCDRTLFVYLYNNSDRRIEGAELTVGADIGGRFMRSNASIRRNTRGWIPLGAVPANCGVDDIEIEPYGERIYVFTPEKQ